MLHLMMINTTIMLLRGNAVIDNNTLQLSVTCCRYIYLHLDNVALYFNYGNDKYVIFDNESYI